MQVAWALIEWDQTSWGVNLSVSHDLIWFDLIWFDFDFCYYDSIQNRLLNQYVVGSIPETSSVCFARQRGNCGKKQSVYKILEVFFYILNCKLLKCKHAKTNPKQKVTFIYTKLAQIKTFWQKKVWTVFKISVNAKTSSSCIKLIDQ